MLLSLQAAAGTRSPWRARDRGPRSGRRERRDATLPANPFPAPAQFCLTAIPASRTSGTPGPEGPLGSHVRWAIAKQPAVLPLVLTWARAVARPPRPAGPARLTRATGGVSARLRGGRRLAARRRPPTGHGQRVSARGTRARTRSSCIDPGAVAGTARQRRPLARAPCGTRTVRAPACTTNTRRNPGPRQVCPPDPRGSPQPGRPIPAAEERTTAAPAPRSAPRTPSACRSSAARPARAHSTRRHVRDREHRVQP